MSELSENQRSYVLNEVRLLQDIHIRSVAVGGTEAHLSAIVAVNTDAQALTDAANLLDGEPVWYHLQAFRNRDFVKEFLA